MADPRFFNRSGPFTLGVIAELTGSTLAEGVDDAQAFNDVAPLQTADASCISFLDNAKYVSEFEQSKAGACFVRAKFAGRAPKGMICLLSEDPYRAYAMTAAHFYPASQEEHISKQSFISDSATIGSGCQIAAGVFIGDGVSIGDGCRIGANTVITHALIGNRAIIHPNVNIGQDGFGFAMSGAGHLKVPQLGRVIIEDDVEIGAGTCIDRGAGPDTIIGMGAKIDNLVQIGHNVKMGRHAVIVSQTGISGSTEIGDFVVLGGQVGVAGHISIGAGAQLAARTGAIASLEGGKTYGGTPAMPIKDWHRQTITLNELISTKRRKTS